MVPWTGPWTPPWWPWRRWPATRNRPLSISPSCSATSVTTCRAAAPAALPVLSRPLPNLDAEERPIARRSLRQWPAPDSPEDEADNHDQLAEIHEKNNDHHRAIEELTKAVEARPDFADAWGFRGMIYL